MTMLKTILIVLVLVTIVPAVSVYADKDKMSSEEWNDKDYEEAIERQEAEEKALDEDDAEDNQRDACHEKGGMMKRGECEIKQDATLAFASEDKHDRDENDLKDNENEDPCFYEGFRVDNDNSFCD
jgi:hypothetical protein